MYCQQAIKNEKSGTSAYVKYIIFRDIPVHVGVKHTNNNTVFFCLAGLYMYFISVGFSLTMVHYQDHTA